MSTQMKSMGKKTLCVLFSLLLVVGLWPGAAWAANGTTYDKDLDAYIIDEETWNAMTPEERAKYQVDYVVEEDADTGESRLIENGTEGYNFGYEDGGRTVAGQNDADANKLSPEESTQILKDQKAEFELLLMEKLGITVGLAEGVRDEDMQGEDEGDSAADEELMLSQQGEQLGALATVSDDGDKWSYSATKTVETFTAPEGPVDRNVGYYKLEVWGARGGSGNSNATRGGDGGYATGVIRLDAGTTMQVRVGTQGGAPTAGWNGGGAGYYGDKVHFNQYGCAGGGATDIRIEGDTLLNRVIVGAGGGGSFRGYRGYSGGYHRRTEGRGGDGGGLEGGRGRGVAYANAGAYGGTQSAGGAGGGGTKKNGYTGGFGQGANTPTGVGKPGGGGGGGWWGGGSGGGGTRNAGGYKQTAGGGGSSFMYTGQVMTGLVPSGSTYAVSEKYALTSASTKAAASYGNGSAAITRLKWKVSYNGNGGTGAGMPDEKIYVTDMVGSSTYLAYFTIPNTTPEECGFTRTGYTFVGWNTRADGTGESYTGVETTFSADTVLYAQWQPNVYTVSLDPQNTTSDPDVKSDGTAALYQQYEHGVFFDESCDVAYSTASISALITKPTMGYKVTFDPNEGVCSRASDTAEYEFAGYFDAATEGTQRIAADGSALAALTNSGRYDTYLQNTMLYAHWNPTSITLPTPTRAGYTFAGWYTDATEGELAGNAGESYTPLQNIKLYARWTPNVYTLTLDNAHAHDAADPINDGKGTRMLYELYNTGIYGAVGEDGRPTGEKVDSITPPKRIYSVTYDFAESTDTSGARTSPGGDSTSYNFTGYFTQSNGGSQLIGAASGGTAALTDLLKTNTLYLEDATLYAQWEQTGITLPDAPEVSWEGHDFTGWGEHPMGDEIFMRGGSTYYPTRDEKLYSYWQLKTYKIDYTEIDEAVGFNPPGAVASQDQGEGGISYSTEFTVPNPTRPGYEFLGWEISGMKGDYVHIQGVSVDPEETPVYTTTFSAGGTVLQNLRNDDGTCEMKALWKPLTYEVELNDNEGSGGTGTIYQEYDTEVRTQRSAGAEDNKTLISMNVDQLVTHENSVNIPEQMYRVRYDYSTASQPVDTAGRPSYDDVNYQFNGYFTSAQAGTQMLFNDGKAWQDGTPATNFLVPVTKNDATKMMLRYYAVNATLFAQWTNPGQLVPGFSPDNVPYNRFIGWNTAADGSGDDYRAGDTIYPKAHTMLYAQWDSPEYTVSYNANGGTGAPAAQTKYYNVALPISEQIPSRANYVTNGPTVLFNANGAGATTGVGENGNGGYLTTLDTTTYAFTGWNIAPDGSGAWYMPTSADESQRAYNENASALLYAQWQGTTTTAAITLPQPVRTGYLFDGWYTQPSGGESVGNAGDEYVPQAGIMLYAHWTPVTYTLALYDGNTKVSEQTLTYDALSQLPSAEQLGIQLPGWTLAGWEQLQGSLDAHYANASSIVNLSAQQDETVNLYAVWKRDITFVGTSDEDAEELEELQTHALRGFVSIADIANQVKARAELVAQEIDVYPQYTDRTTTSTIDSPIMAPLTGWIKAGWLTGPSSDSSLQVQEGETFTPTDVTTFYAGYARDVTLNYDGNGANFGETAATVGLQIYNASGDISTPTLVLAPNGFTRSEYFFNAWDLGKPTQAYNTWTPGVSDEPSATTFALWEREDGIGAIYTIVFDANGGEGNMAPQEMVYGTPTALSANQFTRDGYAFVDWNTAADGTGEYFTDGEEVSDLIDLADENGVVRLYAKWASPNLLARAGWVRSARAPATGDTLMWGGVAAACAAVAALAVAGYVVRRKRRLQ